MVKPKFKDYEDTNRMVIRVDVVLCAGAVRPRVGEVSERGDDGRGCRDRRVGRHLRPALRAGTTADRHQSGQSGTAGTVALPLSAAGRGDGGIPLSLRPDEVAGGTADDPLARRQSAQAARLFCIY